MTTPVVADAVSTLFNIDGNSRTVTVPTTNEGDGLIMLACSDDNTVFSASGWNVDQQDDDSTFVTTMLAYKTAGASEPTTTTVTTSTSDRHAFRVFRITGADFDTQAPEITQSDSGGGGSTTADPASVTPAGGSDDYLYLATIGSDTNSSYSAFPSGYINTGQDESGDSGAQVRIGWAEKSTTGTTTEDPGAFTISASRRFVCYTVAITPEAAAGTTVNIPVGALVLTGQAPTIDATDDKTAAIPLGALTLTGFAPIADTDADATVDIPTGALSLTGFAPSIIAGVGVEIPVGALNLAGFAPNIDLTDNLIVSIPLGALTLTGFAPVVDFGDQAIEIPLGSLNLTGFIPTILAQGIIWTVQPDTATNWTEQTDDSTTWTIQ